MTQDVVVHSEDLLARNSKWRKHAVPQPSAERRAQLDLKKAEAPGCSKHERARPNPQLPRPPSRQPAPSRANDVEMRAQPTRRRARAQPITVRHWGRLFDGALLATSSRIPWAD